MAKEEEKEEELRQQKHGIKLQGFAYLQFVFDLVCKFFIIALWHCWPLDMKYVVLQSPTIATLASSDKPEKHAI